MIEIKSTTSKRHLLMERMLTVYTMKVNDQNNRLHHWSAASLHFARVVDDVKCIVVTRVCVSVCLFVRGRMPTVLHGPGCNLGEW